MKKILKFSFMIFFVFFIILENSQVKAMDLNVDDVISFMQENNILDNSEYFYMFGKMLNGSDDYDINSFKYTISIEGNNININVTLIDTKEGQIEKNSTLTINDNLISYTNNNDIDSLDSRVDAVIFSQLIYSIGGARGYNKDSLIDWMNQIDLNTITIDEGIDCIFENVKYNIKQDNRTYEYEVSIPKSYTININKITEQIPSSDIVEIQNIEPGISTISMTIFSQNHSDEICNIYRKNNDNNYELVGKVSCNNGEFMDNNLKESTTYYYQATIEDKIMCSSETKITTEKSPKTGTFAPIISLLILIIIGIVLYTINKKNILFKKI